MENTTSQNKAIREHLLSGKTLTSLEALKKFGCLRLSGRVYDVRRGITVAPLPIHKEMIEIRGKRVARYSCDIEKLRK